MLLGKAEMNLACGTCGLQWLCFFTLTNARGLNNPPSHPHPFFSLAWIPLSGNTEICSVDCGTHGVCMGGTCRCEEGWTGPACNQRACHPRCAEHGTCKDGKCECSQGWNGEHCTIGRPARLLVLSVVRFCLRWNRTHLSNRLAIHPQLHPNPYRTSLYPPSTVKESEFLAVF